jgi:hypothetical protein
VPRAKARDAAPAFDALNDALSAITVNDCACWNSMHVCGKVIALIERRRISA